MDKSLGTTSDDMGDQEHDANYDTYINSGQLERVCYKIFTISHKKLPVMIRGPW